MGLETHELSSSKLVNPEFLSTAKTGKKLVERRLTISRKNSWSNATMHRSVYKRFDMDEVPDYDAMTEYRPITLPNHLDFKDAYGKPGSESDPERRFVAAYIEERLPPNL
jgi:hypothetical protein